MANAGAEVSRDDVRETGEQALAELISHPPSFPEYQTCSICMTSGTSGSSPIVTCWNTIPDEIHALGGQRPIVALGSRNARLMFLLNTVRESEGVRVLALDNEDVQDTLAQLVADFAPDGFCGTPAFAARIGEHLDTAARAGILSMLLLGEQFTLTLENMFKKLFPNGTVQLLYGALEIGHIGIQPCGRLPRNCYHPVERATIEIADAGKDDIGDMLVSKTFFRTIGVRRYRIGDLGRWGEKPCACGRRYFEVIGRNGFDRIKIAGALLLREEFDRVANCCQDLFDDYRADAREELVGGSLQGAITLTVYAQGRTDDALRAEIARRFSDGLYLTGTRTLSELVAAGYFLPLRIEFACEPLPPSNKDIKVRKRTE